MEYLRDCQRVFGYLFELNGDRYIGGDVIHGELAVRAYLRHYVRAVKLCGLKPPAVCGDHRKLNAIALVYGLCRAFRRALAGLVYRNGLYEVLHFNVQRGGFGHSKGVLAVRCERKLRAVEPYSRYCPVRFRGEGHSYLRALPVGKPCGVYGVAAVRYSHVKRVHGDLLEHNVKRYIGGDVIHGELSVRAYLRHYVRAVKLCGFQPPAVCGDYRKLNAAALGYGLGRAFRRALAGLVYRYGLYEVLHFNVQRGGFGHSKGVLAVRCERKLRAVEPYSRYRPVCVRGEGHSYLRILLVTAGRVRFDVVAQVVEVIAIYVQRESAEHCELNIKRAVGNNVLKGKGAAAVLIYLVGDILAVVHYTGDLVAHSGNDLICSASAPDHIVAVVLSKDYAAVARAISGCYGVIPVDSHPDWFAVASQFGP